MNIRGIRVDSQILYIVRRTTNRFGIFLFLLATDISNAIQLTYKDW